MAQDRADGASDGPAGGPAVRPEVEAALDEMVVPPPTMTPRLGSTVLLLEAFVVLFAALAATPLLPPAGVAGVGQIWLVAGVLVVAFVLAAGAARRPHALAAGAAVQGLLVATGFFVPLMFAVGLAFAALWVWLVVIGRRIDADRRRWAAQLDARRARTAGS